MSDDQKRGRGRPSNDETISRYLEGLGISREELEASRTIPPPKEYDSDPETYQDMYRRAIPILWRDFESLSGVAKVNAFKAIQQLAKDDPGGSSGDDEDEREPLIADVIDGIEKLPADRKRTILERELAVIDAERTRILEVMDAC